MAVERTKSSGSARTAPLVRPILVPAGALMIALGAGLIGAACGASPASPPAAGEADANPEEAPMTVLARATGPIALGSEPVGVTLEPVTGAPGRLAADIPLRLILRDLHTDAPPGVLYRVHLGRLDDDAPEIGDEAGGDGSPLLGTFNFFGTLPAPAASDPPGSPQAPARFYSFELPPAAQLSLPLTLTLAPRGRPAAEASPTVGAIELVQLD